MPLIQEQYSGSIDHLRPFIKELKDLCIENDFELLSVRTDNHNFVLSRGIYLISIEQYELEKEIWIFLYKNGIPIFRKNIKDKSELEPFKKLALSM